jgi:hypothetical protein
MEFGAGLLDHPRRGFAAVARLSPFRERLSGVMRAMVEMSNLDATLVIQIAVNATIERRQISLSVKASTNS